ncbi:hypothetical protein GIB67_005859 [Kingdonia uniflora]|uniref:Uncharacterized protein n=1 Tax=Kingdonia uniflora TaxID=39325 RepID=A0A7J7M559_9MAGN|nr:hypothetical protein GIB67_005859 [Kingdonia uniflora]
MGRKRVYGMNLMIMVICSLLRDFPLAKVLNQLLLLYVSSGSGLNLGIGGDYPLSATIMSEYANKKLVCLHLPPFLLCRLQNFSWRDGWNYPFCSLQSKFDAPSYEVDPLAQQFLKLITFGDLL